MSFIGAFKNTYYLTKQYLILLVLFPAILYPQDPPSEFDFNISIYQSFYFFINSDIDGEPLIEDEDWIAAFHDYDETMEGHCINIGDEVDGNEATNDCQDVNGDGILSSSVDVCVGSYDWSGEYTTVPVMGDDQTQWTAGYMRGPEDFKDCNEDGSICDNNCNADGTICLDCDVSSAPDCSETQWEGFWTPDLGNGQYDIGEPFFDANVNGQFDPEGEYPKFKIYDASENLIYDAVPETSEDLSWANFGFYNIDILNGVLEITVSYSIPMHYGANLVSFHALPEDVSLASVMESLGDAVTGVIGEGVAASPNPVLGWVGSLSEIERTSGYWIKMDAAINLELEDAIPSDPGTVYNMHYGANLISFPIAGSVGIADGIPDDVEEFFTGVIGEGVAATPNPALGWVGSLSEFEGTKGYWAKVDGAFEFSYDLTNATNSRLTSIIDTPYEFVQSSQQAFYFIKDTNFNIQNGDWIVAYHNNMIVGSRQWNGLYTDIPVMGYDGESYSAGYCNSGDTPTFVWMDSDGQAHNLTADTPVWLNNEIYNISLEYMQNAVPDEYSLIQNYPNPFNPSTTISFSVPTNGHVTINVFDINGRLVSTLLDDTMSSGYHNVTWDAADMSAGLYIYTLQAKGISLSNKMILMK